MSNTPLNADDRLRHMIARQFVKRYRHGSLMTNGELNEEAATLRGSVYFDNIMRYIERDRKKHELQARIDENNRWRTILAPSFDHNTVDMEDFNDRAVELKQELEKL